MSYQVLARKWRPKRFQDVIGQDHIVRSFQNAIKNNTIAHAYLLTGTRGVGKTSIARIFAKALRCEDRLPDGNACNKCRGCLDFSANSSLNFVEIDGASNNGVDQIRELIAETNYAPSFGKYKIYLIDEVHMVTQQAFNALLKTLEEPPPYIIFIFATTESHKLPGTVLSRCQRFDFRQASIPELIKLVEMISKDEQINFEMPALINEICKQGNGSVRDTLSFLDQVLSYTVDKKISEDVLVSSLGITRISAIKELVSYIITGNQMMVSKTYRKVLSENVSVKNIASAILDYLFQIIDNIDHQDYLKKHIIASSEFLDNLSTPEIYWIYENLAKDFEWILKSISSEKIFEIILKKMALRRTFLSQNVEKKKPTTVLAEKETTEIEITVPAEEAPVFIEEAPILVEKEIPIQKNWEDFLMYLQATSPVMCANLEQGNILNFSYRANDLLDVNYGFKKSAQVFLDHLTNIETKDKLMNLISEYYSLDKKKIRFNMSLVGGEENSAFSTRAEDKEKFEQDELQKTEHEFRGHPLIKKAEELFNSKVDKVIITKK